MTVRLRYDGKVFIPETPVTCAPGAVVVLDLPSMRPLVSDSTFKTAMALFEENGARVNLPESALSRESIYEDRG